MDGAWGNLEEMRKLAEKREGAAVQTLREGQKPYKAFRKGAYLEEAYVLSVVSKDEGVKAAVPMFSAMIRGEVENAIEAAAWILATYPVLVKDTGDDGNEEERTTSFRKEVERSKGTITAKEKTISSHDTASSFVLEGSPLSGYEEFVLVTAMYVAGFNCRGVEAQANQINDAKWLNNLKNISGFSGKVPESIKVTPGAYKTQHTRTALGAGLFMESIPSMRSKLGDAFKYALVRPVAGQYSALYKRFMELDKIIPNFTSNKRILGCEAILFAVAALHRLASELAKVPQNPQEVWAIRAINSDYLSYLAHEKARKGAACILYMICVANEASDGKQTWSNYINSEASRGFVPDLTTQGYLLSFVRDELKKKADNEFAGTGLVCANAEEWMKSAPQASPRPAVAKSALLSTQANLAEELDPLKDLPLYEPGRK